MQKIFKIPLFFTLSWLSPLWMRHGLSYSPVMYHICTKCDSSDAEFFSRNHKMSKVNKESDKSSTASYRAVDLKILLNNFIHSILLSYVQCSSRWRIIYQNKAPQNICLNEGPPLLTLIVYACTCTTTPPLPLVVLWCPVSDFLPVLWWFPSFQPCRPPTLGMWLTTVTAISRSWKKKTKTVKSPGYNFCDLKDKLQQGNNLIYIYVHVYM